MKKQIATGFISFLVGCVLTFFVLHRYQFHTGHDGRWLWRTDLLTGNAAISDGGSPWEKIKESVEAQTIAPTYLK